MCHYIFKNSRYLRYFLAEFLGTFLLVSLGDGCIAQVVLGNIMHGDTFFGGFLNIALGYGAALMVGVTAVAGVSGGHLNPAVTLAMAVTRRLEWTALPVYMIGQYMGAFMGAVSVWSVYYDAIGHVTSGHNVSDATRGIFASYPTFDNKVCQRCN